MADNATPLLQAEGLTRHYQVRQGFFRPAATVKALNGVSFQLSKARTLAVVVASPRWRAS